MNKVLWSTLVATPAIFAAALFAALPAIAAEARLSSEAEAQLSPTSVSALSAPVASTEMAPMLVNEASAVVPPVSTQVAQLSVPVAPAVEAAPADAPSVDSLNQVVEYSNEGNNGLAQAGGLTIDRLSDVRPSDWAYTALQNLVEKYGAYLGFRGVHLYGQ